MTTIIIWLLVFVPNSKNLDSGRASMPTTIAKFATVEECLRVGNAVYMELAFGAGIKPLCLKAEVVEEKK